MLRVCETLPTFSPLGLKMPISAPTYRLESKAEHLHRVGFADRYFRYTRYVG